MSATNPIPEHSGVVTRNDTTVRDAAPTDPSARFEKAKELARARGTVTQYADASTALERPVPRDLFGSAHSLGFGSLQSYKDRILGNDTEIT